MTPRMAVTKILIAAAFAVMGFALIGLTFDKTTAAMSAEINPAVSPREHVVSEMRQAATDASDPVTDTTVANFQAGSGSCYVAPSSGGDIDGELILTPTIGVTFSGNLIPTEWYTNVYTSGGAGIVSGGVFTVAGAYAGTSALYPPSMTLEFSATFGAIAAEHVGLTNSDDLYHGPWALFSTGPADAAGDQLYARTFDEITSRIDTPLGSGYLGSGHRYRIDYTPTSVVYSIDGSAVATHTQQQTSFDVRPIIGSLFITGNLAVDWLRMSPYATSCVFESRVFDAGQSAPWQNLSWTGQQPAGTIVGNFETRSGDVITPGLSWSAWTPVSGTAINVPNGQYIQYRTMLTTTDSMQTPAVESVALSFGGGKSNQTITVVNHAPATAAFGASFTVTATASSGLPVAYSASGVCTNAGNTFTLTSGTGTCTVQYNQAGDANYNAAPQVTEAVTAQKAAQTITVVSHAPASAAYGASFTVTATASSGLPVAYSASGACINMGNTFTMTSATGTCTVQYNQAGNGNYNAATQVTETVTAQKLPQTITVVNHAPASAAYGASFTVTATASSGLAVTYSASGVCTNAGNTFTLTSGTGTCTVQYDQAGNGNYNAAPQVTETVTAQKLPQTITVVNHAPASAAYGASFTVTATASSGLEVTYSASGVCTNVGNTFTMTSGTGTCTVRYDQAGNDNYSAATQVTETVTAQKVNQTITFGALPDLAVGAPPFTVTASASSGLAVTFTASGPCSVAGSTVTLTGAAGTCIVTAHQAGDSNYTAAPDLPQSFKIAFRIYVPLVVGRSS